MVQEKKITPEVEDQLLAIAESLFLWKKMPESVLNEEIYADPERFLKEEKNKFRINWFNAISNVVLAMVEDQRILGDTADSIKSEDQRLMNKIIAIEKSGGNITSDLVAEGNALLEKLIGILQKSTQKI